MVMPRSARGIVALAGVAWVQGGAGVGHSHHHAGVLFAVAVFAVVVASDLQVLATVGRRAGWTLALALVFVPAIETVSSTTGRIATTAPAHLTLPELRTIRGRTAVTTLTAADRRTALSR